MIFLFVDITRRVLFIDVWYFKLIIGNLFMWFFILSGCEFCKLYSLMYLFLLLMVICNLFGLNCSEVTSFSFRWSYIRIVAYDFFARKLKYFNFLFFDFVVNNLCVGDILYIFNFLYVFFNGCKNCFCFKFNCYISFEFSITYKFSVFFEYVKFCFCFGVCVW